MKYKYIEDLTSDVMFEAYGKDTKELFENSAEALFGIICKLEQIEEKEQIEITAKGENIDALMINWLQELIAIVDTEEMFLRRFQVEEISENHLIAKGFGEPISPEKGETVVKAVTYYKFLLEKVKEGFKVKVTLDI